MICDMQGYCCQPSDRNAFGRKGFQGSTSYHSADILAWHMCCAWRKTVLTSVSTQLCRDSIENLQRLSQSAHLARSGVGRRHLQSEAAGGRRRGRSSTQAATIKRLRHLTCITEASMQSSCPSSVVQVDVQSRQSAGTQQHSASQPCLQVQTTTKRCEKNKECRQFMNET